MKSILFLLGCCMIVGLGCAQPSSMNLSAQLRTAAETGNLKQVRALLSAGVDVNQLEIDPENPEYYLETPLMLASQRGHVQVAQALVEAGANVNQIRPIEPERCMLPGEGNTALEMACPQYMDIVQLLVKAGTNAQSVVRCAVRSGNTELLHQAVKNGAEVNATFGDGGVTLLQYAVEQGDTAMVQALLRAGADINYTGDDEDFSIMEAAKDRPEILAILKTNKAKQDLIVASEQNDIAKVKMLLSNVEKSIRDREDTTALIWATKEGRTSVVKALLAAGVKVDECLDSDDNGTTALMWAATQGHIDIVRLLLASNADVNRLGAYDGSALEGAVANGHMEIVKLLLANGADVNAKDNDGNTALKLAQKAGNTKIVELLKQAEAKE